MDCLNIKDNFYEVQYEFNENLLTGYIPYEFASVYKPEQEVILSYNAKIISQTDVYSITNGLIIDDIKLSPGHQIYIYESFDSKAEFTKAKFKYNNQVVIANIPTANLSPNGLNKGVIIALSIISALVGVVLILLGLKKKKKKKLGTKN